MKLSTAQAYDLLAKYGVFTFAVQILAPPKQIVSQDFGIPGRTNLAGWPERRRMARGIQNKLGGVPQYKRGVADSWRPNRRDYVFRFAAAFLKTPLIAVAIVPSEPTAAKESKTSSKAYSVRSWPSSSCHSFIRRLFIFDPLKLDFSAARTLPMLVQLNKHLRRHTFCLILILVKSLIINNLW